jgi:hypothetical protein
MKKVDLMKDLKELYTASDKIEEVTAERGVFLCVDGQGDPDGDTFKSAVESLRKLTYAVRTQVKKAGKIDFKMSRPECRWMSDPGESSRSEWSWCVMVRVPDEVTQADLKEAREAVHGKEGLDAAAVRRVSWREGRALQVMHVGPYDQVGDVYAKLGAEAERLGYRVRGPGHEIYVNDPSRVEKEKLKTIVRLPIAWPRPDYARG